MTDWISDAVDDPDGGSDDEDVIGAGERSGMEDGDSFAKQLQAIVAAGNSTVAQSLLEDGLSEVDDEALLQRVLEHVDGQEKEELVRERLDEVGGTSDPVEDEDDTDASDDDETEAETDDEDQYDIGSTGELDTELRSAVVSGTVEDVPVEAIEEFGGELEEEVVEKVLDEDTRDEVQAVLGLRLDEIRMNNEDEAEEETVEDDDETEPEVEAGDDDLDDVWDEESEEDDSEASNPTPNADVSEETDFNETETVAADGGDGEDSWESTFDDASVESEAIDVTEAAEMENRWSMLVWSDPGRGKTHFGYTAKEPVCIIDTEGKAHHLADRFNDKKVKIYQPSNYDEALDALHDALDLLQEVKDKTGRVGTVVVDSMSIMWDWAQQKYVDKFYRNKNVDEVEFSSAIGSSGKSDWKQIKRYHNVKFRQAMIDSDFHFLWTAMAADDYNAAIEESLSFTPQKPSGEKDNEYKASEVFRLRENDEGVTVGELEKSDKIGHLYTGLRKPTFPKHKEVVDAIKNAENGSRSIDSVETEFDIEVFEGNPRTARINDDESDE